MSPMQQQEIDPQSWCTLIWKSFMRRWFPLSHFLELLGAIYTNTTAVIRGSTKEFTVAGGCQQHGVESPFIFNVIFDTVSRVIHRKLIAELGDGYRLQLKYRTRMQATDRNHWSRFKSCGNTKLYRVMQLIRRSLILSRQKQKVWK